MNLDHLLKDIRNSEPDAAAAAEAAARVKARLFPPSFGDSGMANGAVIKGCPDYRALIPAHLGGSLDPSRRLLLEVHLRECVSCRRALSDLREGARSNMVEFKPRKVFPIQWAIAATVLLTASLGYIGYRQYAPAGAGVRATVESIDGALYKVEPTSLAVLTPGAELNENERVRTAKNSTAVLRLADGSRIELNQRAEISVSKSNAGATIHLSVGNIIVQAAKQRTGTLQVATADCNVSVKGTIFSVNAGTKGSRVAVAEGTVWVDHGSAHDVLHKGDVTSTASDIAPVPVREEFAWSRNSTEYLTLLKDFDQIRQQIAAIPAPALRHESALMAYLPVDLAAVAAIPNVGDTLTQASKLFHDRLQQSGPLATWWSQVPAARRSTFEKTIAQLETASTYLGNEIVIAGIAGQQPSPVILAQLKRPGFDTYLKSQLPANVFDGHMRFDNDLFVAAANPADLDRISASTDAANFTKAPLYRQIAPLYQQGAGWLVAADLGHLNAPKMPLTADALYVVAESRTVGENTENHASVTFAHNRKGVAAWLAAPGPMGSLDFVSPDAAFAATMLLKNPALIANDLNTMLGTTSAELASAFSGEVTVALDGPLLPAPSWKVIAEVDNPERLRATIAKLVESYNAAPSERTGILTLSQTETDGRAYYRLHSDKLPWEAHWTFEGEYWIAAASHELLVRSLQNRETGYTLAKSAGFRAQLPHDASADFSAVVWHNLGPTVGPLYNLLGGTQKGSTLPKLDMKPGVICFWAAPDRIDVATLGGLFGMNLDSMLAMQGSGPLEMLRSTVGLRP
jgi:hypothetical protein